MTETAQEHGVDIRTSTTATALVVDNGSVVGVKIVTPEKEERYLKARDGVLLTAGGFEMNRAMLAKYTPTCLRGIVNVATPPYNDGACIRMGLGVGADMSGYNSVACFDGSVEWEPYGEFDTTMYAHVNKNGNQAVRQPWLLINRMGQRVPYLSTTGTNYPFANTSPDSLVAHPHQRAALLRSETWRQPVRHQVRTAHQPQDAGHRYRRRRYSRALRWLAHRRRLERREQPRRQALQRPVR